MPGEGARAAVLERGGTGRGSAAVPRGRADRRAASDANGASGKWARRKPAIAALATAVVVTVFGGLIGTSLGLIAAVRQTELAEQRLYDARMNLVEHYWEDNNDELLQKGLAEQLPARQAGVDRRGFEWFYWQRKISSGTFKGHSGRVSSVVYSPDGKRVASAGSDGTVKIWDGATGRETRTLNGHTGPVLRVAFSPDGKRLASARWDKKVKVWDVATGLEALTLKGRTAALSVAFSPNGQRLASGSQDQTVQVWDARPMDDEPAKPGISPR